MGQTKIDAAEIPYFYGDLEDLEASARLLALDGGSLSASAAEVLTSWQGLCTVYQSPDSGQLLSVMAPVKTSTTAFAGDLAVVARALTAYANELRPIMARLSALRTEAESFVTSTVNDHDWDHDQSNVNTDNRLIHGVNAAVVEQEAAERRCANAIEAVFGARRWHSQQGGVSDANTYGFDAIPDSTSTPWGSKTSRKDSCPKAALVDVGRFSKGFVVDGLWGTLTAIGTLTNPADWPEFSKAWAGLGKLVMTLSPLGLLVWGKEGEMQRLKEVGKGLIGYDQWKTDPSRAAGGGAFSIASLLVPGGQASAVADASKVARVAEVGGDAAKLARVGSVVDVSKGALEAALNPVRTVAFERLPAIGDFVAAIKLRLGAAPDVEYVGAADREALVAPAKEEPAFVESGVEASGQRVSDDSLTHADGPGADVNGTADRSQDSAEGGRHATPEPEPVPAREEVTPDQLTDVEHSVHQEAPAPSGHASDQEGGQAYDLSTDELRTLQQPGSPEAPGLTPATCDTSQSTVAHPLSEDEFEVLPASDQTQYASQEISRGALTFRSNAEAAQHGSSFWNETAQRQSLDRKLAIFDYTAVGDNILSYHEINGFLRGKSPASNEVLNHILLIDEALRVKPVAQDIVVSRGTDLSHYDISPGRMAGRTFIEPGFMSTSLGEVAFGHLEAVFHLRVPIGTPALYLETISAFGDAERELLLGRDLSYEVTRVFPVDGQWQIYGRIIAS